MRTGTSTRTPVTKVAASPISCALSASQLSHSPVVEWYPIAAPGTAIAAANSRGQSHPREEYELGGDARGAHRPGFPRHESSFAAPQKTSSVMT